MIVKLLTEHHLEFLRLKGGCRGSSVSSLVKMSNCWKSHVTAHYSNTFLKDPLKLYNLNTSPPPFPYSGLSFD